MATVETLNAGTTTWVAPAGVTSVQVDCFGVGGKGSTLTGAPAKGGGGSAGAWSRTNAVVVVPGVSYTVQILTTDGSSTWFSTTGIAPISTAVGCLAQGGNSVSNNNGTGAATSGTGSCIGDSKFQGGAGANGGGTGQPGGGGESGSSGGAGDTGLNTASVNSHAAFGAGAGGWAMFNNGDGPGGGTPGGGGCGAARTSGTRIGGPGGPGQIVLTYTAASSSKGFFALAR